ncbi:GNAT family N-acetyltransferase [Tahibacter amnicola]|uniref:GNAT family N-acetyltransferase n=1 Tax=Tahibacter amnicola TaxID=2976241 RepID=A0ABY6BAB7_9GAMM|nr:GNAT family N-acetyltransferase [Tahibacter amnicola]UXI66481.1 GNAT family N-acetyltransferase [Tahibacter amnicola]
MTSSNAKNDTMNLTPQNARLCALTVADFDTLGELGRTIWRAHYISIITIEQIEYMLNGRYTADKLQRYIDSSECWLELLWVGDELVGYCSYARTADPDELKLEQLYLLPDWHGRGLGGFMLRHVEQRARDVGCSRIMLTVNKQNTNSIAVYRKSGFTVREEAVFDIGNGYVMDDYVMVKNLA